MTKTINKFFKLFLYITTIALTIIIPICCLFAPITYVGNMFANTWGNIKSLFANNEVTYEGKFTEDYDNYEFANRISLNYDQTLGCVLYDMQADPITSCLELHDENGNINTAHTDNNSFDVDWNEWNGYIDDSYFKEIHVLGKYNVSKWEKIGEHIEYEEKIDELTGETEIEEIVVDDYDWVFYPEIQRGECKSSDTLACNIILEDKYVYPFQQPTFSLDKHYGADFNSDELVLNINKYQTWTGDMLYAFSKGEIVEADNNHILISIIANDIDLYALYETHDGSISCEFDVGDIVEATELIAFCDGGDLQFSLYNSNNQYINPAIFIAFENAQFAGIGSGTIIIGYEDFAPDFDNRDAYVNKNGYYKNFCGQCTWFAWGLFYQHYGFSPTFTGNGENCARQAYNNLKSQGWTLTRSPSPGAIFSTVGFNHVGIVAGVIDENTMIIVEGNFNHKNDTLQEFVSLPDWAMRTVSTKYYKPGVSYIFCNPPQ